MTEALDLESWTPPKAPVDLPYQVLERQRDRKRTWFAVLRQMMARRAPHE